MNDDSINLSNYFSNEQYEKYCKAVQTMRSIADKLNGICQTFPFNEEHDFAFIVGTFSNFFLGEEELAEVKEVLSDISMVTIDRLEDETLSVFVSIKRH